MSPQEMLLGPDMVSNKLTSALRYYRTNVARIEIINANDEI